MSEHETIGEAAAADGGGKAAFWHRQIKDAGKVGRDWRKRAEQLTDPLQE
jgi:hypothetical protein